MTQGLGRDRCFGAVCEYGGYAVDGVRDVYILALCRWWAGAGDQDVFNGDSTGFNKLALGA
jgi:hypothetical protein